MHKIEDEKIQKMFSFLESTKTSICNFQKTESKLYRGEERNKPIRKWRMILYSRNTLS